MTIFIPEPPSSGTLETKVQKDLTTAFINTQPVTVYLIPREKIRKPSGGFSWSEMPARDPQVMRLIEPGSIPFPTVTVDGVQRETLFQILGEWDAVIENGDLFELDGSRYEVTQVAYFNGWEQRALVSRFG